MAMLLTCYYRPKPGGLCKRLFRAIEALLADGHEVHYLAVVPFPITHPRCYFHRFPWPSSHTQGGLFWLLLALVAPWQLLWLGYRHRVTHLFAFHHVYAVFMQPLRLLKRLPLTLFLRADTLENHVYKRQHPAMIRFDKVLEGLALAGVRLYGVSETLTQRVVERHAMLRPARAGTVLNDMPRVPRHASPPPSLPLRLACVGVLEVRKNQALAIHCMSYLPDHLAHLYIFGSGPGESYLKKLMHELDVQDRVTFMGWVEHAEKIWKNVDLLVFPSYHEGLPNAILEALAWGVPVLASDIPEHREILPQSSLVPVDDVTAWNTSLQHLILACPERLLQMRQIQQNTATKLCFDWDKEICQRILSLA